MSLGILGGDSLDAKRLYHLESLGDSGPGKRVYTLQPLGAAAASNPIARYGQRAAAHLVTTVRTLPPAQRGPALQVILDKVDPTLRRRAAAHTRVLRAGGVPANKALEGGLAKAMSEGILSELVRAGQQRRAPGPRSLLGMGCYGANAVLGDVLEELGAVTVVDHRGTGTGTVGTRAADGSDPRAAAQVAHAASGDMLQFGPFTFGTAGQRIRVHDVGVLPPAWRTWFPDELRRLYDPSDQQASPANIGLDKFFPGAWKAADKVNPRYTNGSTPIFKGTNPVTGKPMGVFINLLPSADGWVFEAWYRDVDLLREKSGWGKAWDKIKSVAAKIVHGIEKGAEAVGKVVAGGLDKLKDFACDMVNNPATGAAAAIAGGPAGAVGANLAQGICTPAATATPVTAPLPIAPPSMLSGMMLPALVVGGIVLVVVLKRKR